LQLSWGAGLPQTACIVHPKAPDVHRWAKVLTPAVLKLEVSVHSEDSNIDVDWIRSHASALVELPFAPQFIVLDDSGRELLPGEYSGTLSPNQPTTTFWVWTGGHPVEASLTRQLRNVYRGIALVHISEPPDATATPPKISVTVVWDAPVHFKGFEEVELRIESRVTGQLSTLRVNIDGRGAIPTAGQSTSPLEIFGLFRLWPVLLLCFLCFAGFLLRFCDVVGIYHVAQCWLFGLPNPVRAPVMAAAAASGPSGVWAGYGAQIPSLQQPAPRHLSAASTPFKRVDLRPY